MDWLWIAGAYLFGKSSCTPCPDRSDETPTVRSGGTVLTVKSGTHRKIAYEGTGRVRIKCETSSADARILVMDQEQYNLWMNRETWDGWEFQNRTELNVRIRIDMKGTWYVVFVNSTPEPIAVWCAVYE